MPKQIDKNELIHLLSQNKITIKNEIKTPAFPGTTCFDCEDKDGKTIGIPLNVTAWDALQIINNSRKAR